MSILVFSNNAITTVAVGINSTATTVSLAAGAGALFPTITGDEYFVGTFKDAATGLINEIVNVTAISGDSLTIVRGQEGTTARAWSVGDTFANLWTAGQASAMLQQGQYQTQSANYAVDTGTQNAYVAALTPAVTANVVGMPVRVKIANTNNGASTLNIGGGITPIKGSDGNDLLAGQLLAGGIYEFVFNGSVYVLLNNPDTTRALTDLSNAKWIIRADLQGGGSSALPVNTWYESMTAGNSGVGYYLGANASGSYLVGPDAHGAGGIVGTATFYMWDIQHDNSTLSDNNGFLIASQHRLVVDGAGWKGGRIALNGTLNLNATPGSSPGNQNYVGLNGQATVSVNLGGGSGTEQGAVFPIASYLNVAAAATHIITVGSEMDFAVETGAAPLRIVGLTLGDLSTERGTEMDAFINFAASGDQYGNGIGRTYGIAFTDFYGLDPTYSGSTLIGSKFFTNPTTKRNAAWGVDFNNYTFSGGFLKNGDFSVANGITNLDLIPTTTVSLLTNASATATDNTLVIRPGGSNGAGSLSSSDGGDVVRWDNGGLGFFGSLTTKQVVIGALSSVTDTNAKDVLTSIISGLSTNGLMTNSTT